VPCKPIEKLVLSIFAAPARPPPQLAFSKDNKARFSTQMEAYENSSLSCSYFPMLR